MILLRGPDRQPTTGRLSTAHAASSYGIPVLVLADGTVLGPGDVARLGYAIMTATQPEQQALRLAGYSLGENTR